MNKTRQKNQQQKEQVKPLALCFNFIGNLKTVEIRIGLRNLIFIQYDDTFSFVCTAFGF
jgi:hypothetical protein